MLSFEAVALLGCFAMSRNFLGIAITTSTIPRGYPGCTASGALSPLTPRRTPRLDAHTDAARRSGAFANFENVSLRSPRPPSSPLFPPTQAELHEPIKQHRKRPSSIDTSSTGSSTSNSPTENTSFLPISPALITPSLIQDVANSRDPCKLGVFSAINIILGKTIGVGIYSVPSSIYSNVGSVGLSLVVWILGALISSCGLAVYLELGTALPRSGGEKVYLERIFRRPRLLATCIFMSYVVLLGFSTPNCIVLGEYFLYALGFQANTWNVRSIAVTSVTVACFIHARYPRLGLRLINFLGVIKMGIIAIIILGGFASVATGVQGEASSSSTIFSQNFTRIFDGSTTQPYALATAMLKVLYCFRGFNAANSILSEVKNPVRTLSVAAPVALSLVSGAYLLVNVAYFCAVEKESFAASGVVVAGHFFRNVFGTMIGERILPFFIILSAFGSISATSFAQARVNQELAKDRLLPFSDFWASCRPWGSPSSALFLHWVVSVAAIVIPPSGQIYSFLVEIGSYPVSVISVLISGGLLYLHFTPAENWQSPKPAKTLPIVLFLVSNLALLILPWVRPIGGQGGEGRFPYYAYPATGLGVMAFGGIYWLWWSRIHKWWHNAETLIIRNSLVEVDMDLVDWKHDVVSSIEGRKAISARV